MGHSIWAGYDTYYLELEVVYAMHLSTIDVSLTKRWERKPVYMVLMLLRTE